MLTNLQESFLQLARLGIGTSKDVNISNDIDWTQLKALADRQGLSAIVLDGMNEVLKSNSSILKLQSQIKLSWIGEVMQSYEQRYLQYEKAIGNLAEFYNKHGYKMMVLKGYACSLNWPKPEHRPCGDIDIWMFGQYKEADAEIAASKGIKVEYEPHHTVFYWHDFLVENHNDFINVYHHKSHIKLEKIFKKLGNDDSFFTNICGEKVYLPSPNLHSLFLLKHLMLHFASEKVTLRQLLDWAFFVEKHRNDVDWMWLEEILERFGMKKLYGIFNSICVDELGFDSAIFNYFHAERDLQNRIVTDILSPKLTGKLPKRLLSRVTFRYRRWKANEWKHKLCYKESMWSAFWYGIFNHLNKPSAI